MAERFELFICGIELANAFVELTDPDEQRVRFMADRARRHAMHGPDWALDEDFLAALGQGMPQSAGIAMGFDRLAMIASGADRISQVLWLPPRGSCMIGHSGRTVQEAPPCTSPLLILLGFVARRLCRWIAPTLRPGQLSKWVGKPETELVGLMGAPSRTYEAGGMKFLTYEERHLEIVPATAVRCRSRPFTGTVPGASAHRDQPQCDTTFTIAGRVGPCL